MSNAPDALTVGKWIAGIAATIIAAPCLVAHPSWRRPRPESADLTDRDCINTISLDNTTPSPATESPPSPAPHAPAIVNTFGVELFEEQQRLVKVGPGEKVTLTGQELWSARTQTEVDCLSGFLAITWIVRDPYPKGGEDLQLRVPLPKTGGSQKGR